MSESKSNPPLPGNPTPDPTTPRDPRRIASVVVQRVGRGSLSPGESAASPALLRPVNTAAPLHVRAGKAVSPLTLAAGSLIPAVLTSGVNSDAPGSVSAVVSYDVFDSLTGRSLLVPAGSRLLGSSGTATHGQNRLEITWNRLTFPMAPPFDPGGRSRLRDRRRASRRAHESALQAVSSGIPWFGLDPMSRPRYLGNAGLVRLPGLERRAPEQERHVCCRTRDESRGQSRARDPSA